MLLETSKRLVIDNSPVFFHFADELGDRAMVRMVLIEFEVLLVLKHGKEHHIVRGIGFENIDADLKVKDLRDRVL